MSEPKKIPRIATFDIMRGFFLTAIIIDHLAFFPNLLDWWGMRGFLLASTAEGFFLISGIVLGIVRGAKLIDAPFKKVAHIVFMRALTLYLTHIVLVIGFTLIGWYFFAGNPNVKYGILADHSWFKLIWDTITLQYIYGWADYLRLYAIFIAISPAALWLLRHGKWYLVLATSYAVWLLFPLDINQPWEMVDLLQPISWQVIFFTGLVVGFHWLDITTWCNARRKLLWRYIGWPLIAIAITTFAFNVYAVFIPEFINTTWAHDLSYQAWWLRTHEFHKEQLPWPRLGLFLVWFWASFLLVQKFEKHIVKYTGWLLLPFGTNSLYVYTLHAVILFFVHIYLQTGPILQNFAITVGVIALIYSAVRTKFLMKIIPR